MKTINLSKQCVALVDDGDYDRLNKHKWSVESTVSGIRYAVRAEEGQRIKMHRAILDAPTGIEVDHIDGDGLNNTRQNLRLATHRQNSYNVAKKNRGKSKYKGVSWRADRKKWKATLTFGKQIYLGLFDNELDAAIAYNRAAKLYFGQHAWLNNLHASL